MNEEARTKLSDPSIDALDARVNSLENGVRDLDKKVDVGFLNLGERIEAMAQANTRGTADLLHSIEDKISRGQEANERRMTHAQDVQDRNRPSLSSLLVVAGSVGGVVLGIIGGYGSAKLDPIYETNRRHEASIDHINETTEKRDELDARFRLIDAKTQVNADRVDRVYNRKADKDVVDQIVKRIDEQATQNRSELAAIRDKLVSRAELEFHWGDQGQRFGNLNTRVDSLQHQFSDNFTIGDQVKNLQAQLDALRLRAQKDEK